MMIIIRCGCVMSIPDQDILLKIFALIIRSVHLWIEFSVLMFGRDYSKDFNENEDFSRTISNDSNKTNIDCFIDSFIDLHWY